MKTSDIHTRELMNGLFILLEAYPQARVRKGYGDCDLFVRGVDDKLCEKDKELLDSWGWQLVGYEDEYFWEFELIGNINDKYKE